MAGSAKFSEWSKDGETKHGLSVTASAILSAYDVKKRRGEQGENLKKVETRPVRAGEFNDPLDF